MFDLMHRLDFRSQLPSITQFLQKWIRQSITDVDHYDTEAWNSMLRDTQQALNMEAFPKELF